METETVIKLGKKIVSELELDNTTETLSKWMAHYLSELLSKTETAIGIERQNLEKECSDLVIKLWERRYSIPIEIDPLRNISSALTMLQTLSNTDYSYRKYTGQGLSRDPYDQVVKTVLESSDDIIRFTVAFSLANELFDSTKKWRDEFPGTLSELETQVIDMLDSFLTNRARVVITFSGHNKIKSLSEMSPDERNKAFLERLNLLVNQQKEVLIELKKALKITH